MPHADLKTLLEERSRAVMEGWYQALRSSAIVLHSPSQLRSRLSDAWDKTSAFLLLEDGPPREAEPIGAFFIGLGTRAREIGQVQQVLLTRLLEDLDPEVDKVLRARASRLIAGLTTGFAEAERAQLLEQQEEMRAAYGRSLQDAEDRVRILSAGVESSINGILMFDLEGKITYVNQAFLEMWGYAAESEVRGRHISEFGEWQGDAERALEVVTEQGGWVGELVALRRDGTRFDVQASASFVEDSAGRAIRLMAFFVDITERKKMQDALRQRASQAAFLNAIGEEIAGKRTAQDVVETAVSMARNTLGFHQVAILLLDRERRAFDIAAVATSPGDPAYEMCSLSLGEGITGWAAQQNRTLVVDDVEADPRHVRLFPGEERTCSELVVPIRVGGQVIGVLDVQSPVCGAFGAGDQDVLETLADQIAVGLENARLYQALQNELVERRRAEIALRRSVRRLETVHEIDQAILGAKSREEIANAMVEQLAQLVPCQRVSVDLFDWEEKEVTVLAAIQTVGEGRAKAGTCFPLTQEEWLSDLWRSGTLADIRDARELPASSPLVRAVVEDGIRSFLAAPVGFGGELMGLLTLGSDQLDGFEADDRPILKELADTLAIALQQARLFDSVKRQRERLRKTMARLAEAEEIERHRVVRELHDRVGQNLTALDLNLSTVRTQVEREGLGRLVAQLEDSLSLVAQTNRAIRQLMIDLRPPVLDDYGLLSALHWYADRFSSRAPVAVVVHGREGVADDLSPHMENALFRITQEALNNIVKHAQADEVAIALTRDEQVVRLTIRDNGVGFALEEVEDEHDTWGLLTMRERAESVGAHCLFDSAPGEGTRVVVEVSV